LLVQEGDEYPILKLNEASWEVMRKQRDVALIQNVRRGKGEKVKASAADTTSWEGVDRELFEALRAWRGQEAQKAQKPAYIIFSDATLRELARVRPSTSAALRMVYGIGEQKLRDFGRPVLERIAGHCREHGLAMDVSSPPPKPQPPKARNMTPALAHAFSLFRQGTPLEDVMHQMNRSRSTVCDYLCEYIRVERPADVSAWIDAASYAAIAQAARQHGTDRLKPIHIALGEKYDYDKIRIVVTHLTRDAARITDDRPTSR
jgi:ATP-dependent DNA helicase RecQ